MTGSAHMIPKEGGMLLYRGILKDERKNSLYQVRKHAHSSERERMRVLQVLKLLDAPKCQSRSTMIKRKPPVETRKQIAPQKATNACSAILSSPYHSWVQEKKEKAPTTTTSSSKIKNSKNKTSKRLIVRDDYMWHPMTISSNEKEDKVILDVMKHYRNQYLQGRKKKKKAPR